MLAVSTLVFALQPYVGVGAGTLDWNIARDLSGSAVPNVLSELEFENVDSRRVGLAGSAGMPVFSSRLTLFAEIDAAYAQVDGGKTTDADFAGNNRTDLYSLSRSQVRGDEQTELSGGVGLEYALVPARHYLALIAGSYYQEHNLNFKDGNQLVADPGFFGTTTISDLNASLENLDSDYRSEWWGPWLALRYRWQADPWHIALRQQWYQSNYYGEGRWNLRDDFAQPRSFEHRADGDGWRTQLRVGYAISERWDINISWLQGQWQTDAGVSTTFFSDDTTAVSRFNGGRWESSQWRFGLGYIF